MDIELMSKTIEALGVFIGGIGTAALGICAWISFIYGLNLFKTWQKQKQFEKK